MSQTLEQPKNLADVGKILGSFTKETSKVGVALRRKYAKQNIRLQKQLARMGLEKGVIEKFLGLSSVLIATPLGSWIAVYLLVDFLGKIGWLNATVPGTFEKGGTGKFTGAPATFAPGRGLSEVDTLKALLVAEEIFSAIAPAGSAILGLAQGLAKT